MTLDEFLAKVRSEGPRTQEREVMVPGPALLAEMRQGRAMRLTDLINDPRRTAELRLFHDGHVLGPGASPEALAEWKTRWLHHPLPRDLVDLVLQVNGIHLWADLATGRAYQGLAPIEEWDLARVKMWGQDADPAALGDQYLALSYHADASAFVVLNVDTGRYFLMDSAGPDETCRIGGSVNELLDWLWEHRIPSAEDGSSDALS